MTPTRARNAETEAALLRHALARLGAAQAAVRERLVLTGWSAEASLLDMRIGVAISDMLAALEGAARRSGAGDASALDRKRKRPARLPRNGPKQR